MKISATGIFYYNQTIIMKKIICLMLVLIVAESTFSQQITPSPTLTKQDYLLKSRHQKTAAWLLLGGGLTLSTIGSIIAAPKAAEDVGYVVLLFPNIIAGNPQPEPQNDYTVETIMIIGGTAAMLSSIPLFIASGKNKRKAMNLSFKNETAPQIYKSSLIYTSIPSLSLKFHL